MKSCRLQVPFENTYYNILQWFCTKCISKNCLHLFRFPCLVLLEDFQVNIVHSFNWLYVQFEIFSYKYFYVKYNTRNSGYFATCVSLWLALKEGQDDVQFCFTYLTEHTYFIVLSKRGLVSCHGMVHGMTAPSRIITWLLTSVRSQWWGGRS